MKAFNHTYKQLKTICDEVELVRDGGVSKVVVGNTFVIKLYHGWGIIWPTGSF